MFFGYFGAIWAPLSGPKKKYTKAGKWTDICPMSKLKKKPHTKSLGPFL
jgi:hypothetical protein